MTYQLRTESRPCPQGMDGTVYILEVGESRAEIWPALGFNCLRWQVRHKEQLIDLLWSDPNVMSDPQPTRSGIPILFPFPNRIRGARFTWEGKEYQLPINDPQKQNAIHGFACYRPWRIVAPAKRIKSPPREEAISLNARFVGSHDAPECQPLWPTDYAIAVQYTLKETELIIEARVTNNAKEPGVFGLGFHPYFRFPANESIFYCDGIPRNRALTALEQWMLLDNLPTGERIPLATRHERLVNPAAWQLPSTDAWDDAYRLTAKTRGIRMMLVDQSRNLGLQMECSRAFRDLVVFTPPHRGAVCLEPYTCVSDAMNLHQRGVNTGLIVLPNGHRWRGWVRLRKVEVEG